MNGISVFLEVLARLLTAVLDLLTQKKVEGQINENKDVVKAVHENPGQFAATHFGSDSDVVCPESQATKPSCNANEANIDS